MNRTIQRESILRELRQSSEHPTADQLYELLRKKLPQISLGTVYRNLEKMAEIGKIRKLSSGGKQKRFDAEMKLHFHIRCPICGKICDSYDDSLFRIDNEIKKTIAENGWSGYNFELLDQCERCRNAELTEKPPQPKKRDILTMFS